MALITVTCPCCQAELHIDPAVGSVIPSQEHVKPPTMADMEEAVSRFKGEETAANAFNKSVADHKDSGRRSE